MDSERRHTPPPPRVLRLLARLLIHGRDASYIIADLDASFARDVERGLVHGTAARRYTSNVFASAWSVWTAGLRGVVTHGVGLDVKLGVRMLARQPLVTIVAVFALGLGIPASLTLLHGFHVIYGELPIPDGDRVVGLRHYDRDGRGPLLSSLHDYESWTNLSSFESIGAARSQTFNVDAEATGASPVRGAQITASSFGVLRARPLLGRVLNDSDELEGAPDVVLIGEDLWSARFARDPDIVGRSVRIGRTLHTVVGVMPADFQFPLSDQIWLPFRGRAVDFPLEGGPRAYVFGRLADGVSMEDARAEMAVLTDRRASDDPEPFEHLSGQVVDLPILLLDSSGSAWERPSAVVIQILIFGLLLVVCGNVGTLILARTAGRSSELAIRTALGASRTRILTQLFVEMLVLTTVATGLGLLGANALVRWVTRLQEPYGLLPYWVDLTLNLRIVAIALGLAVVCAVVAGVLPALSPTSRAIQAKLQGAGAHGRTVRFGLGSSLLIVTEIALSVGFLATGATRLKSTLLYQGSGMGFDPSGYVVGTFTVPQRDATEIPEAADSLATARLVKETQQALLARLSEEPSVVGVAMGIDVPGLSVGNRTVILETPPESFDPVGWDSMIPRVDVSFFSGLHRPIVAGRDFNGSDVEGPPDSPHTAVIVNESFVRDVLGGRNAIGQRLRYAPQGAAWGPLPEGDWYEIVGVVGPYGTNPENSARDAAVYHPLAPGEANPIRYTVQVAGDADAFVPRFRQIAASVNPDATLGVEVLASTIRTEALVFRAIFGLMTALAGAAFLLSSTGLYALLSFTVWQRTREIGIRTALGARPIDILSTVARRAAVQVGIGLILGVAWGWFLLNMQRTDVTMEVGSIPLTLAVTVTVTACVGVVACVRPLLRGLRVQPTEALKES